MTDSRDPKGVGGLRSEFEALFNKHAASIEAAEAELATVRQNLEDKIADVSHLRGLLAVERSGRAAEATRYENQIQQLQSQLRAVDEDVRGQILIAQRAAAAADERCNSARAEADALLQDVAAARSECASYQVAASAVGAAKATVEAQLREESLRYQEALRCITSLRRQLDKQKQ